MDFHSLSRRELQSLCKLNKIPANITNIAMADALQSLEIVEGMEEYLKVSEESETADMVEKAEVFSPKARTAIRPKAKTTEAKTVTRTTRRGSKQLPSEVEEPKNDLLETPALSRTTRKKAPATSSRRNVSIQLNECEKEEEGLVETRYSTRRSTRLVEKTSDAPRVKKGTENAVKIDSILGATSEEPVEVPEETEVEDICDAFEKLDVLVMEEEGAHKSGDVDEDTLKISEVKNDVKPESDDISVPVAGEDVDCVEISNLKQQESHETSNLKSSEVKNDLVESDGILSPCEDENPGLQKLDLGDNFATEHVDVMFEEEHENLEQNLNLGEETCDAVKENSFGMVQEESVDSQLANIASLESDAADAELGHEDTLCEDVEMNNQVPETKRIEGLKTDESFTDAKKDCALSNDKENMVIEKEKDEMNSLISIRQLKKQLKALTLKNLNSKEDTTTTRPALQALSDNQMMVGAETQNKM